jgi:alanine racemase
MAFITIHKENFYHNLHCIAKKTGSIDKIAIVLKDNAYGHGLLLMAKMASEFGIRSAVVRDEEEAREIDAFFEHILVLGDTHKYSHHTYVINSLKAIEHIPTQTKVALKVDTGMHRNGIAFDELALALKQIQDKDLNLMELMTHYRSADVLSSEFFWQQKVFEEVKKSVKKSGFKHLRIHSHNSASILRTQGFDEDIVRVGLALYGYNELPTCFNKITLKPILSLYAKRISSRCLKRGQRVGYGGEFIALTDMKISTYDLGYGDGWHRGECVIAQNLAILGRVSMDSISVESEKSLICIMDNAEDIAQQWGTISYEVLTCLDNKIVRKVI